MEMVPGSIMLGNGCNVFMFLLCFFFLLAEVFFDAFL